MSIELSLFLSTLYVILTMITIDAISNYEEAFGFEKVIIFIWSVCTIYIVSSVLRGM